MIYLDNAATTWPKPPQVMQALNEAMRRYGAKMCIRDRYRMAHEISM